MAQIPLKKITGWPAIDRNTFGAADTWQEYALPRGTNRVSVYCPNGGKFAHNVNSQSLPTVDLTNDPYGTVPAGVWLAIEWDPHMFGQNDHGAPRFYLAVDAASTAEVHFTRVSRGLVITEALQLWIARSLALFFRPLSRG